MGTIEHRKLFRAETSIKACYEDIKGKGLKGVLQTVDISSIGLQAIGCDAFAVGVELKIHFYLPQKSDPIEGLYRVIWQKQCQYQPCKEKVYYITGLMLFDMTPEHAIITSDFIFDVAKTHQNQYEKSIIDSLESL